MDTRVQEIIKQGDKLFSERMPLMTLCQEIADNFYPERADFTVTRGIGEDFAAHLSDSYPVLARRDLGDAFSSILRPKGTEWFHTTVEHEDRLDNEGRAWLEWATGVQRRAMYDRSAQFDRATKEADHDFAAFGNPILTVELSPNADSLLFRSWHLRDVVWCENASGEIDTIHRKCKMSARTLKKLFGNRIHKDVETALREEPFKEFACRHVIMPAEDYKGEKRFNAPYVSLYVDVDNEHLLEEAGSLNRRYVIPRWKTVSGSQYGYSPAVLAALPDARLIQQMTLTLLEASEKAVNPPMIGVREAIRSDLQIYAGGFTAVDAEYDERLGEVLRPMNISKDGLPYGLDVHDRTKGTIAESFYLNRLSLPPANQGDMTAFETRQRIQEYIRRAIPLFEPAESEYNTPLCEEAFAVLMQNNAFGPLTDLPDSLRRQDVTFKFESPLHEMAERQRGETLLEAKAMMAQMAEVDPTVVQMIKARDALRDVFEGIGTPAKWIASPQEMEVLDQARAQAQQAQALVAAADTGAGVAEKLGKATQSFANAAVP